MKTASTTIRKWGLGLMTLVIAGLLFSACRKTNDDYQEIPSAGLMAFNLAPDKYGIGIALSGNSINNSPLNYSAFTGQYLNIYTGNRSIQAFDFNSSASFTNTNYNFEQKKYYSLFIVGSDSAYRNIVAVDNFDSLSSTNGKAYVRFINAIPDSSRPTVKITANGTSISDAPAAYTQVSEFAAVDPGAVSVDVSNGSNITANRSIDLSAKKVYTILIIGKPGESGNKAVQIRFIENGTLADGGGA